MRCLYSPVKDRRLASATISGLGRGGADGWGETVLPAAVLRSVSLRSSSPRSAAGKTVGEVEDIPLFFTLISVLALLINYDRENCLINVGTEGWMQARWCRGQRNRLNGSLPDAAGRKEMFHIVTQTQVRVQANRERLANLQILS